MKHILTSGCSFSDPNGKPKTWVRFLEDHFTDIKFIHRGIGCSGNKWIALSLIYEINKLLKSGVDKKDIIVIPMWSGIHRVDFIVNEEDFLDYKKIVADRDHPPGINSFIKGFVTKENYHNSGLLTTGGFYNGDGKKLHDKYIRQYYEDFYVFEAGWVNTLTNILLLQNICKINNISLLNLSWQSIFDLPLYDHARSGHADNMNAYENLTNMNTHYPTYSFLYDLIDFDLWWFCELNNFKTGGLGDWCNFNNMPLAGSHPILEAHSKFVDEVVIAELKNRFNVMENI